MTSWATFWRTESPASIESIEGGMGSTGLPDRPTA